MRALGGWRLIRISDGFSVGTNAAGPREVLDELFGEQQRAVCPIEDVTSSMRRRPCQLALMIIGVSVASQSHKSCGVNW